jgi:hypothetical protein
MMFDNVNVEGDKYFPYIITVFNNLIGLLPYSFTVTSHIIVTSWQMGFQYPNNISEGLWVFNQTPPVFVVWLLVSTVYYFVEFRGRNNSKFFHSKEFEDVWRTAPAPFFFFLVLTVPVIGAPQQLSRESARRAATRTHTSKIISQVNTCTVSQPKKP